MKTSLSAKKAPIEVLEIKPLVKPPDATVNIPGSKSITNRALILAALSEEKCMIRGALWSDDTQVMVDSLQRLGFEVKVLPDAREASNRTILVTGQGGKIPATEAELFVGNAGTAARFLTALVALGHGKYRIYGDPRMHVRPMQDLFVPLRKLGVEIDAKSDHLPVTIRARGLNGGKVTVDLLTSTQFASALLLISKPAKLEVVYPEWESEYGYLTMTQTMIENFTPDYTVEADYSSASYFWAAEYITKGKVKINGWTEQSSYLQMDERFPKYLPPPLKVSRRHDLGDSILTLAICALFSEKELIIMDAEHMREQECNRIKAMVAELTKVGALVRENSDGLGVFPAKANQLKGAEIETYKDHRMAMCFSILGLVVPGIRIRNPMCVNKTFPSFYDKLETLHQ